MATGLPVAAALILGATLALSSTAVVARLIADRHQENRLVGVTVSLLDERAELRRDMAESSAWMGAETITTIQKATIINEEGRTGRPPEVLTDERG